MDSRPVITRGAGIVAAVLLAISPCALAQTAPPPSSAPAAAAQPAKAGKTFSQEELEQLLAPIALYPDNLFAQVLMASTYPLEIVQAERWVKANPKLKDKALEDALQKQPWDPAVKGLTAVPQVLTMMSEKIDWTQKLGDAFLAQQEDVMKTAQGLRQKAQAQGNLKSSKEITVATEQVQSTTVIKIEQADPQVMYVPTYNPTVVYGAWAYPAYPPYYYYPPGYAAAGAFWGFTAGVIVGGAIWGNSNWGGNDVNVNVNKYNNFNKANVSNGNWQHNAEHRGQVPYRDQNTAQKYDRGNRQQSAQNRDSYRGRDGAGVSNNMADSGRAGDRSGDRAGDRPGDRAGDRTGDRTGDRAGDRAAGPSAGTRDVGAGGAGNRGGAGASAGTRDVGAGGGSRDFGGGGPSAGSMDRGGGGNYGGGSRGASGSYGGSSSAFGGSSGASTRQASSRGSSSMSSSRGGGGGARGGGGGRGGGGRR